MLCDYFHYYIIIIITNCGELYRLVGTTGNFTIFVRFASQTAGISFK